MVLYIELTSQQRSAKRQQKWGAGICRRATRVDGEQVGLPRWRRSGSLKRKSIALRVLCFRCCLFCFFYRDLFPMLSVLFILKRCVFSFCVCVCVCCCSVFFGCFLSQNVLFGKLLQSNLDQNAFVLAGRATRWSKKTWTRTEAYSNRLVAYSYKHKW